MLVGNVPTPAKAAGMSVLDNVTFDRVAQLAAKVLGAPFASVVVTGGWPAPASLQDPVEWSMLQRVVESGTTVIIGDVRRDPRTRDSRPAGEPPVLAWAGLPIRDQEGAIVGALCVADHAPRSWGTSDLAALESLALLASVEFALRAAVALGAEQTALARMLQATLLPERLPQIPGLQVAVCYSAGAEGMDVLGDFYDVFPSVPGSWGVVVGDVCGQGVFAAKSTVLARYTLRAEAQRRTRPSVILAGLNRALLDWLTADPRFLTAIYATVWLIATGVSVQISSAGHPLALVRRADGRVREFGRPGTLLGLLPVPELSDSRGLLRPGDSLVLFTDGITEARDPAGHDLFGEDRLRDVVAGLGDLPAAEMAEGIRQATLAFAGGPTTDDAVVLVLKVPEDLPSAGAGWLLDPGRPASGSPGLPGRLSRW
jgi:sigma-B regulation protein RsbU (phosphoserine phosphatase)